MTIKEQIEQIILNNVKCDIYNDIYGHDRAAEEIVDLIQSLINQPKEDQWEDRSGGQFTAQEIEESRRGGHGW